MALKTFNLDSEIYEEFSRYCKKEGISMSKKIDNFIREEVERISGKRPIEKDQKFRKERTKKKDSHTMGKYC